MCSELSEPHVCVRSQSPRNSVSNDMVFFFVGGCQNTEKFNKHSKIRAAGKGVKQRLLDVDTYEGENIFALTDCHLTGVYTG